MRVRVIPMIMIVAAILIAAPAASASGRSLENTSRAVIDAAYAQRRIDFDEMTLLKAISLYAPDRLPEEYRGADPDKCGTPLAREIDEAMDILPSEIASEIRGMRARPVCDTSYDTAHFRIHFDTSGQHMILNWPDTAYRDAIATALEHCWSEETDVLGFRQPPNDGSDPDGGGGSGHYDVYLQNLSGLYGYCQGAYTVPATPRTDATSYVVIDNDYAGFGYPDPTDPMKVTVAHEFCHACQFSHNYTEETWYLECTSMWAEDMVYDDINDYRGYIFYFYNYPYNSLEWQDATGLRIYGSCVWNFFLSEHVDPGIVVDIWYEFENAGSTYDKIDTVLGTHGTSLEQEYVTFAVWSWFTGSRDDGFHFEEGATWPLVAAERTYGTYPVIGGGPLSAHRPDHLAWNFIHMNNPGGAEDLLDVTYDGPSLLTTPNYAWTTTKADGGGTGELDEIMLNGFGNGNLTISAWNGLDQVCIVAVNASRSDSLNDMIYTVSADRATPVGGAFYATAASENEVTLRWTLAAPEDVVSLDVLRAMSSDGDYVQVNEAPLAPDSPGLYVDTDVRPGDRLWYKLMATLWDGTVDMVGSHEAMVEIGGTIGLSLAPPWPNPLRESASFEFTIPLDGAHAVLTIYDLTGHVVATIVDETRGRGRHTASWDGTDRHGRQVAAGVYFCSLEAAGAVVTQKAIVLR